MQKYKIYLCGRMSNIAPEEAKGWRNFVKYSLEAYSDILVISPCDFYSLDHPDSTTFTQKEIREYDLQQIKNCDIILYNLDHPDSVGSAIEASLAERLWNKPIIAFGEENHPWIELTVTKRCKDVYDAIDYILNFYYINK